MWFILVNLYSDLSPYIYNLRSTGVITRTILYWVGTTQGLLQTYLADSRLTVGTHSFYEYYIYYHLHFINLFVITMAPSAHGSRSNHPGQNFLQWKSNYKFIFLTTKRFIYFLEQEQVLFRTDSKWQECKMKCLAYNFLSPYPCP